MKLALFSLVFSLVAGAQSAGHGSKSGSNVAPSAPAPAGRATAQLNDEETAEAVTQALEDFREITGQSSGTGERTSTWSPQSMQEMGR